MDGGGGGGLTYKEAQAADQAHEVVALGDADGFFDGHGLAAAAFEGSLRGGLGGLGDGGPVGAKVVAEEDGIC